jgi:hypothetical protein
MSAAMNGKKRSAKPQDASDEAVSYDEFKDYEGRKYTGMKIGTPEPSGARPARRLVTA